MKIESFAFVITINTAVAFLVLDAYRCIGHVFQYGVVYGVLVLVIIHRRRERLMSPLGYFQIDR